MDSAEPDDPRGNPRTRVPLKLEEAVMAAAMALLVLITFGNVVTRYLTNISFAFTEEYSISLMVIMTLVGASVAFAGGRHIRIGYFVDRQPPAVRRRVELFVQATVIAVFAMIAVFGARSVYEDYRFEVTSAGLGYPEWIYTMWLPILSLAIIGRAIGRAVRVWRGEL